MSRGGRFAQFNAAAQSFLEADVGPVEDPTTSCGVGPCESDAVFRVPWHSVGGDVAHCGYHLARYREQHPDLFERVQDAVLLAGLEEWLRDRGLTSESGEFPDHE